MTTSIWMTLATPAGKADLYLNDIPVIRLGAQHAVRMPVNEYALRGSNIASIRPSRATGVWSAGGEVTLKVEQARFDGDTLAGLVTLLETSATVIAGQQGETVLGAFSADVGSAPDLGGLLQLDPSATPRIAAELRRLAGLWRERDWDQLLLYLDAYIRQYVAAYGVETRDAYAESFVRMAASFMEVGEVEFDERDLDLDICASGRLADCLSRRGGAAIKVRQPDGDVYDFNLIVGIRGQDVVAVR